MLAAMVMVMSTWRWFVVLVLVIRGAVCWDDEGDGEYVDHSEEGGEHQIVLMFGKRCVRVLFLVCCRLLLLFCFDSFCVLVSVSVLSFMIS